MIMSRTALIAAALVTALSLTACTATKAPEQPPVAVQPQQQTVPVPEGAKAMLKALADVKADVDKNDAAQAKVHAGKIEEAWMTFEDAVKAKDKTQYQDIEDPLHTIIGGTKSGTSLDKPLLTEQITKLESLLTPLTK
jgi:uncharacterized low-complexity protein